jgi:hypothetical protein
VSRASHRDERGGAVLSAAVLALAVGAVLAAAVADTVRTEVRLAQLRRAAADALAATDACVARVLADLPAGWEFDALVHGSDGVAGTADDGAVPAPADCAAVAGGARGPARVVLTVGARSGRGRRTLDAAVGRAAAPGLPALLWLAAAPPPDAVEGLLRLDGADESDPDADWAALAAPADPLGLDAWRAGVGARLETTPRTAPPLYAPAPPLAELALRLRAAGPIGAEALLAVGPPAPSLVYVEGDLVVSGARVGAGLLFVGGTLDIQGRLDFTGLVIASGGLGVADGGTLTVEGAAWIGEPGGPGATLAIAGTASLRQGRAALDVVDRMLPLPRRAVLLGLRDAA